MAAIGGLGGRQVGQGGDLGVESAGQGLFLLLQGSNLLLDPVALFAQLLHGWGIGSRAGSDALAHFLANAIALRLEVAALFLEIPLLAGEPLQGLDIKLHAAPAQLSGDQLRIGAQQALIQHGLRAIGPSLGTGRTANCTCELTPIL